MVIIDHYLLAYIFYFYGTFSIINRHPKPTHVHKHVCIWMRQLHQKTDRPFSGLSVFYACITLCLEGHLILFVDQMPLFSELVNHTRDC